MNHADPGRGAPAPPPLPLSPSPKVKAHHLERQAVVYIRQSTPQQLLNNRESTDRQYALQHRAVQLGWPAGSVTVIDDDQGQSGVSACGRSGFQSLLAQVALDQLGIILRGNGDALHNANAIIDLRRKS